MLCKHEVTGSIPVSSTKTQFANSHSLVLARRHSRLWRRPRDRPSSLSGLVLAGFMSLRARASSQKKGEAMMFDNKIDWVTRLEWGKSAARRASRKQSSERV